jgi:putative nucleotidyltransferase with HDIG domain
MLRVPIDKVQPGMILARPIPLPQDPYLYLVQRDKEIPPDLIPRLKQLGILEVWVRHRDLEFLEELIDEGLAEHQREVYLRVRESFQAMLRGSTLEINLSDLQSSIAGLFDFLKTHSGSNVLLQKLDAFDNYLIAHSANVCYLALLVGMRLERYLIDERCHKTAREAKDLRLLGLGCLLHDVGKMLVPREILDKPGKLTPEERATMQQHTVHGFEMVRGGLPAAAAQIVLNHHQRFDGCGYPPRWDPATGEELPPLAGRQIPVFSRIAILADVYDASTTNRCYSPAKLPVEALHEMRTVCASFFDPVVAAEFFRVVPPFPIGQVVRLSNGIEAAVVGFSPQNPARPRVQCLRTRDGERFTHPAFEEIDLSLEPELSIATVNGRDVAPFLPREEAEEVELAEVGA